MAMADSGFSSPLCFAEKPLTAQPGNGLTPAFQPRSTPLRCAITHDPCPLADCFLAKETTSIPALERNQEKTETPGDGNRRRSLRQNPQSWQLVSASS
jgi:hypothetical protein